MKDNLDFLDLVYEQEAEDSLAEEAFNSSRPLERMSKQELRDAAVELVKATYVYTLGEGVLVMVDIQNLMRLLTKQKCNWDIKADKNGKPYFENGSWALGLELVNKRIVTYSWLKNDPKYHIKLIEVPHLIKAFTGLSVSIDSLNR